MNFYSFPANFHWGTATAAYQIEGATAENGRTPSIWDTFAQTLGKVKDGDSGEVACDHYHRFREDIAIMASLGVTHYRFSISWPRITPQVTAQELGPINQAGLNFYRTLIAELLAASITPVVTLYHWDLPQTLEDAGGWAVRQTAYRFAEYAAVIAQEFGGEVNSFTTFNEPWCTAYLGYASGVHAPGRREPAAALAAVHHLNLAHGLAAQAIRAVAPACQISITLNLAWIRTAEFPDPPSALDATAIQLADCMANGVFLDPILRGHYPPEVLAATRDISDWSFVQSDDLKIIRQPLDSLGLNYYTPTVVRHRNEQDIAPPHPDWVGCDDIIFCEPTPPVTAMNWSIDPRGIKELLLRLHREYPGLELNITENGAAYPDEPTPDGAIVDLLRIEYLAQHLAAVAEAIAAGAPVRGYFLWSLLDNFEWAHGYSKRFGIVHVDYQTQRRTIKNSGHWYADLIRTGSLPT